MQSQSKRNHGILSEVYQLLIGNRKDVYLNVFNSGIVIDVKETLYNIEKIYRDYSRIKRRRFKRKQ